MIKTHTVNLESGEQYEVTADHELHYQQGAVGCSLVIHSVKPVNKLDTAITDELLEQLESALAYLIIDEYNDDDTDEDFEGYPC
jgi:hypothetical protein